jgi:hypothetical protein
MGRIERYSSAVPVPVERAQPQRTVQQTPFIDPSGFRFSTGDAKALQQIGGVLERLGKHKVEMQDRLGLSNINAIMENAEREYEKEIINSPLEEHAAIRQKHIKNAMAFAAKERLSAQARPFADNKLRIWSDAFSDAGELVNLKALAEQTTIQAMADYEAALTKGGQEDIAEAQSELMAQLSITHTPIEAKTIFDRVHTRAIAQMEENAISNVHAAIEEGSFEVARELAKNPQIPEPRQTTLRNTIKSAEKANQTQIELAIEQKDDEIGSGFLELLANKLEPNEPQLSFKMIIDSDLSQDAKEEWFGKLRTFDNYSEGELKEAFTDKGEVLADIYDKIDNNTLADELDTMVGKGLSPGTAERIKKEIRAPYEKDTEQLFKRIFGWTPELGFENELSAFLYEKTLREWQTEIKKQKATGDKIVEIGRSIARPYFIEHIEKTMMGQDADIPRMVELALGEEIKEPREEVKSKEDEGPRTYIDFENEVARLKKIDMGKARAFYDAWIDKFVKTKEVETE